MLSLDSKKLAEMSIPVGTGWLLGSCMEARGRQDLWMKQKPQVLRTTQNEMKCLPIAFYKKKLRILHYKMERIIVRNRASPRFAILRI